MSQETATEGELVFKISPFVAHLVDEPRFWLKEPHKSRAREILRLINAIHSTPERPVTYDLKAACVCGYNLQPFEILGGFSATRPTDRTVRCPGCNNRVNPFIEYTQNSNAFVVPLLRNCEIKVTLHEYRNMKQSKILKENPSLCHSAIVQYGVLSNAFRACGIRRRNLRLQAHERAKLLPFLGRLPVNLIAAIAGIKAVTVQDIHKKYRITPCSDDAPPPSN
jgi:hypothetical protein